MKMIKSKYKGVTMFLSNGKDVFYNYQITHKGVKYNGTYKTEREAALQFDKRRIEFGKEPLNILKPKK